MMVNCATSAMDDTPRILERAPARVYTEQSTTVTTPTVSADHRDYRNHHADYLEYRDRHADRSPCSSYTIE